MEDFLITNMTERFGSVKRARDCFLYTEKGIRLTDLYQEGGRAILGWGKGGAYSVFKNVLERKIIGTFDTDFSPRADGGKSQLSRAVSALLGDERSVLVFNSEQAARACAESFSGDVSFYAPWSQDCASWREKSAVIIAPTFPFGDTVFLVALRGGDALGQKYAGAQQGVYRIPAPLCAAVTRSIYDLISELGERGEKDWFIYDTVLAKYWTRKGPYLFPKVEEGNYRDFVLHCLDCALVISPRHDVPSIVPFGADKGNFSKLAKSPFGSV